MMNRGCGRNCVWMCRLMVVFNIACLIYLGLHYYYVGSYKSTALASPNRSKSRIGSPDFLSNSFGLRGGSGDRRRWRQPPAKHDEEEGDGLAESNDEAAAHGDPGGKLRRPDPPRRPPRPVLPPQQADDADSDFGRHQGDLEEPEGKEDVRASDGAAPLLVYIVEEHHEVLPYWHKIHAAASKRHGSRLPALSLVHIDGHSDGAPILPDKRYPFTAKFGSQKHINYLMTSNDNFIMGSKVAGLVSNSLWIYPRWSDLNGTDVDISRLGISKINGTLQACSCPHYEQIRHPLLTASQNTTDTCVIESRMEQGKRMWFQRKFCYFLKGPFLQISARQDNISRDVLSAVLTRNVLLPAAPPEGNTLHTLYKPVEKPEEHNDYLLDIDEDFFGVQLAGRQLLAAGVPQTLVNRLRRSLENLFCPTLTMHEVAADRWFVAALDVVASHAAKCRRRHGDDECSASAAAAAMANDEEVMGLLTSAVCPLLPVAQRRPLTLNMARLLVGLTPEQLRVLQSVGLCLGMSLKTNLDPLDSLVKRGDGSAVKQRIQGPEPLMKLCLGHNQPNESIVQEFLDTRQGLDARLAAMADILKRLPKPPVGVTICRSSRDGYVPRQQMDHIEAGILTALRAAFDRIEVRYDPDLYYGKEGWFGYKEKQLGKSFRWPGEKL